LALADVKAAKFFDQVTVATNRLRHRVTPALICYTNRFILQEPSNCNFIAGQKQRFQPLAVSATIGRIGTAK
jgi:hypothetical protein